MLYAGHILKCSHYVSIKPIQFSHPELNQIQLEHYYAVDYVARFYIGTVHGQGKKSNFFSMKLLHETRQDGQIQF